MNIIFLLDALPKNVQKELENKCSELEELNLKLRHENEQLKEIVNISVAQSQNIEDQIAEKSLEIQALRDHVTDLESKEETSNALSKVHRMLTRVQVRKE